MTKVSTLSCSQVLDTYEHYLDIPEYVFLSMNFVHLLVIFNISELPANEKLHDLASLLDFDSTKVSGEILGEESVHCHQQILQEHWGLGDTTVLPGDNVQHLLLGVSTILSTRFQVHWITVAL